MTLIELFFLPGLADFISTVSSEASSGPSLVGGFDNSWGVYVKEWGSDGWYIKPGGGGIRSSGSHVVTG